MFLKVVLSFGCLSNIVLAQEDILVTLSNGNIRGRQAVTPKGTTYFAFQEIPYAAPPVGRLRFQPPQVVPNWDGVLDTTENTKICYEASKNSDRESEDCLYLNVYTPDLPNENQEVSLPVMFYIFGGGFIEGKGTFESYGPDFLIEYDVVIVTINYRLGPFGFLSTQDNVIPGNNGLKDQLFALQWVHDNIHLFGGDPAKVTIFGQSAGASSVAYHFISEKSRGLYRGAILESGSAISSFAYQRDARYYAYRTASFIDSSFSESRTSEELLEFLLNASAAEIDQASFAVVSQLALNNIQTVHGFYYAPVIEADEENGLVTENMYEAFASGKADRVPIIIGINSEEGLSQSTDISTLTLLMQQYDNNLDWLVPSSINLNSTTDKKEVGERIRQIYCGENCQLQYNPAASIRYTSDVSFAKSVIKHAELQSHHSDVYFYQFSYDGNLGNVSIIIFGAERVGHGEELPYLWRIQNELYDNYDLTQFPVANIRTQDRLLLLWTNFAKTLNPTPNRDSSLQNIIWPTVSSSGICNFRYLDIGDNLLVQNHPKKSTYRGWEKIYKEYGHRPYDTY